MTTQGGSKILRHGLLAAFTCVVAASTAHAQQAPAAATYLKTIFQNPPESAKPWVFWYWMNAAVSREGITADLEAMREAGIGGAYLMPINGAANPPALSPPAEQLTPQWWQMVRHAMQEADRLGVKLAMHVSDGFALAGGPWITPELSMQKVVFAQTQAVGGRRYSQVLPQPQATKGYYRDIAVYAYPTPAGGTASTYTTKPQVTTNATGTDANAASLIEAGNKKGFQSSAPCWIEYKFDKPFTCRSIRIRSKGYNYQANRLLVETSDDGQQFRPVGRLQAPRSGWQDSSAVTHAIVPTTARYFRFLYNPEGSEPGAEDLDAAKWKQSLKVTEIRLSEEARINQYEGKNGEVWRVSKRTTAQQVPDNLCVPLAKMVNLTNKLGPDGRLTWDVPPGRWTILRVGHTSTGAVNTTGGGARGLECDKFNPEAITLQFNSWFGEAIKQAGPDLASRVLKIFHVDSWECGSQNWSTNFAAEFQKRRGYDPMPYLPVMAGVPMQSADVSERFLFDVRQTIAELVNDKFYATLADLAHAKGCTFTAEAVAPTMVSDGLLHYKNVDVPMGEFWFRSPTHDKPNDMLDAISGAHIYGKNIVQAEAFTELGVAGMAWDEHPALVKTLQDRHYALGVNRLVNHVFVHNPWLDRKPGMTLSNIGLFFQRDQTWWKPGRAWVDYTRRCQALLQLGRPVVDVAVFTGEETPRRAILPDRLVPDLPGIFGPEVVASEKKRLANKGLPMRQMPYKVNFTANLTDAESWIDPLHGYAYDSFNKDALLNLATVKNGRVELPGGASYGVLVVPGAQAMSPDSTSMSPEVASKLLALAKAGATVLLDKKPSRSPELKGYPAADQEVQQLTTSLQQLALQNTSGSPSPFSERGAGGEARRQNGPNAAPTTPSVASPGRVIKGPFTTDSFQSLGLERDVVATSPDGQRANKLAWMHRTDSQFDIYFISNQLDSVRTIDLSLRVAGRVPELWDPVTGETHLASDWQVEKGHTRLPLRLDRNSSVFVVFRQATNEQAAHTGKNWLETEPAQTLTGAWQVSFDPKSHRPSQPIAFQELTDWSKNPDELIKHYSGTATYTKTFTWKAAKVKQKRVYLELGQVANLAEVRVNGQPCGIAWTAPYRVDITQALKKGKNQLSIDVTNTWANRIVGDRALPKDQQITQTTAAYNFPEKPLLPAGLFGPVTISTAPDTSLK
ncbi:glycosyl hydrolase [Hymenobacter crusticola]|uniref:DNA-binding protein n=1 Tax=Hymenobacter crusticola TaxID=1770526 RepID=A0A243WEG1_9BACT|nr:glycosyl hydrolase [Hymenobacter crusticola]OUJ73502.1 DNA-binding protein [Hymenobacter crusticola]